MTITFLYRAASGEESVRTLVTWNETDKYIQGPTADNPIPKTYLKSRILKFITGHEALLYDKAPPAPASRKVASSKSDQATILFTGFPAAERGELESVAGQGGLRVVKSQVKGLSFLCCGPRAGPVKVTKAHAAGSIILSPAALATLLETGELPGD